MPEFVRYHVDVARRAVEVGENERLLVVLERSRITAAPLPVASGGIKRFGSEHLVVEFARKLAHLVVHFLCREKYTLGVGIRLRVAAIGRSVVVESEVGDAEVSRDLRLEFRHDGHDVGENVLAERLDHFLVIVYSAHAVVAHFDEALVAHVARNASAHLYQTVVDVVELGFVRAERPADCAARLASHLAVTVVHKTAYKAERFFLAAPTHFDCRHEHRILGDDCVLLLLAGYRFFVVSAARAFEVFEKRFGEQLFKLGAERAVQHYVADFRRGRGGDGSYFVVVILLAYIKLVLGVQRVTRVRERGERVVLLLFGEVLAVRRFHRFCARGVRRRTLELLCCGFQILDFIPFVRQVFAFYDFTHFNCAPFVFFRIYCSTV